MNIESRKYYSFDHSKGYPAKNDLYYECLKCNDIILSLPKDSISCSCKNISIDIDYGRISIKDSKQIKLFSQ